MIDTVVLSAPCGGFYERVLSDFSDGFKLAGINSYWCTYSHGDKWRFYDKVNDIRPDLLLEIDSILEDRQFINKDTKHAAWIQDYRFNGHSLIGGFGESDFTYFIINPQVWGVDVDKLKSWSVLYPGTKIAPFCEGPTQGHTIDLSFIGFIPRPVNMAHLLVCPTSNRSVPLEVFLSEFDSSALMQSTYSRNRIYQSIHEACKRYGLLSMKEADLHLIDEILPRIFERKLTVEGMINTNKTVEIYGPDGWKDWREFKEYYKGYVQNYDELVSIYQRTLVNVHNGGLAMHYRVLECMGAGGFIIVNETQLDFLDWGISHYFNAGEHFVHYNRYSLNDVINKYLNNDSDRYRIRLNGYQEVKANHTWRHRAIKVINDLGLCPTGGDINCFSKRLHINDE